MPQRRVRRAADVLSGDDADRYARFVSWWHPAEVVALTGAPAMPMPSYADALARSASLDSVFMPCLLDLVSYLPDDILAKVDRASMAVGLEVRAPLLDHRVVELALAMPMSLKYRSRTMKWALRQLLYRRVPRALVERPKMGFGVPLGDWFRGPLRERMHDYCMGADLERLGIDTVPVRRLWTQFERGETHRSELLWQIFVLVAWSRRFVDAPVLETASGLVC